MWNFFGELIHAAVNFPGSWYDTKLAGASGLYFPKLSDEMTPAGFAILGDSAFVNNTTTTNGKVIRGRKSNETSNIPLSAELCAVDIILHVLCQASVNLRSGEFGHSKPHLRDSRHRYRLIRGSDVDYCASAATSSILEGVISASTRYAPHTAGLKVHDISTVYIKRIYSAPFLCDALEVILRSMLCIFDNMSFVGRKFSFTSSLTILVTSSLVMLF